MPSGNNTNFFDKINEGKKWSLTGDDKEFVANQTSMVTTSNKDRTTATNSSQKTAIQNQRVDIMIEQSEDDQDYSEKRDPIELEKYKSHNKLQEEYEEDK